MNSVNLTALRKAWVSGGNKREIAHIFGLTRDGLERIAKEHKFPARLTGNRSGKAVADPTPEEIAERAAWCRAQRPPEIQERLDRAGRVGWRLPTFAYDGRSCAFLETNE